MLSELYYPGGCMIIWAAIVELAGEDIWVEILGSVGEDLWMAGLDLAGKDLWTAVLGLEWANGAFGCEDIQVG